MIAEYGWQMSLYGKVVGAGAMGVPGGQSHNTFWDLVFMGGFIYFLIHNYFNFNIDNSC